MEGGGTTDRDNNNSQQSLTDFLVAEDGRGERPGQQVEDSLVPTHLPHVLNVLRLEVGLLAIPGRQLDVVRDDDGPAMVR